MTQRQGERTARNPPRVKNVGLRAERTHVIANGARAALTRPTGYGLARDAKLSTESGEALRHLLDLFARDEAIRLLGAG